MSVEYHDPSSCNKCSNANNVTTVDTINGQACECRTVCTSCGFADYWAYGFFESSAEIESNCRKYSFNKPESKLCKKEIRYEREDK